MLHTPMHTHTQLRENSSSKMDHNHVGLSHLYEDHSKIHISYFADLPLILILLVYTDFLPSKFGKILIFSSIICLISDFSGNGKGFSLYSI